MKIELLQFDCSTGTKNTIHVHGDIVVRTSAQDDQTFVDKLQKENSYAVGFIQKTIWEKYVYGGGRNFVVFIAEVNNDMVGYALVTPGMGPMRFMKIQQIAVRSDARRLEYGTAIMGAIRKMCEQLGRAGVSLRCRADLESNSFWRALGFELYGVWEKGKRNHVGFKASNDIMLWKIVLNERVEELPLFTSKFQLFGKDDTIVSGIFEK